VSRHDDPGILEALDSAWDDESGFLGMLRAGRFAESAGEELLVLLESIEIQEGERLHPDFVRLVWFAPLFAEWQIDRAAERGADRQAVQRISDLLRERLMEILGTP
jgi:hypothetical protein